VPWLDSGSEAGLLETTPNVGHTDRC